MSSVTASISDSTTLRVRAFVCVFVFIIITSDSRVKRFVFILSTDTEIKGDVLFLGYYESEFDWSNETAKVNL